MPVKEGDFVLVDYVVCVKEEGTVVETNIEEEAKKAGIYDERIRYEPRLVIVGEGVFFEDVEKGLVGLEEGQEKEIELPPEKAFGLRDPNKVKTIPARELSRRGIVPRAGREIELEDGQRGRIIHVGGGRVVVDFNHPLAGKTLIYKVKVVKILKTLEEKVQGLVDRWLGGIGGVKISSSNGVVELVMPEEALFVSGLGARLRGLTRDVKRALPEVKQLRVVWEYTLREEGEQGQETASSQEGSQGQQPSSES